MENNRRKTINHSHPDYYRNKKMCDDIFSSFPNYQIGTFSRISQQFNVPSSTIRGWYNKWKIDPNLRPYNGYVHGLHNRIFSNEEESSIRDFIMENYIKRGRYFDNQGFRRLAIEAYFEKHINDENFKNVQFSRKFATCFKGAII